MNWNPSIRALGRLLVFAIVAFGSGPRLPAQGAYAPITDQPGFGTGGRVFGLGVWRNELVAGTYQTPWRDGATLTHIGRFDGVRWYPFGSGVPGHVRAVLEFQGDLYAGGQNGVRRWNGATWLGVGANLSGEVRALEVFGGQLYACGDFVVSGTTSVLHIARWNGTAWLPVGGGLQFVYPSLADAYDMVSDGTHLYVGGNFDHAGSIVANGIARWDGSSWQALGSGVQGIVRSLALHGGILYVGGEAMGSAGGVAVSGIASWNGQSWSAVGAGVQYPGRNPVVHSMSSYAGSLFVAGSFLASGSTTLHHIARLSNNQLLPVGGVGMAEVNPPAIFATTVWNNRLYCGGEFMVAGDIVQPELTRAVYHIAAFDGQGWAPAGEGLGVDNQARILGRYRGSVVLGGAFQTAGGQQATLLARFDGDDWQYFGTFDGVPNGMVELNGELWVSGLFRYVNAIQVDGVARFDGTTWHAVGNGLGPSLGECIAAYQGTIYAGGTGVLVRWTGSAWQTFAPSISGIISAMHVHGGLLYIASYNAAGATLRTWNGTAVAAVGTMNGKIESMSTFQGDLIVGGRFTTIGSTAARCIGRYNGTTWSAFGPGLRGSTVKATASFRNELVAAGDFNRGLGENADFVARWTGTQWSPLSTAEPNGTVWSLLADDARGELHTCGWYFRVGARDSVNYSIFEATPYWTDVGHALASPRRVPHLAGDGRLLPGSHVRWRLSSAAESSLCVFAFGFAAVNQPMFGGVLVPSLDATMWLSTDAIGTSSLSVVWPGGLPGLQLYTQAAVLDATGPQGFTASNAVRLKAP